MRADIVNLDSTSLAGWRKPLAVTAIGIVALTACSSEDTGAQPQPSQEQTADAGEAVDNSETGAPDRGGEANESEAPAEQDGNGGGFEGFDPLLGTYDEFSGMTDARDFGPDTNIFNMMSPPFEYCDVAAGGEVCLDDYDEWNRYGYRLRNAEPIVVEWSQDHPQSHWEQTLAVGYYDGGESSDGEHITVITPSDADRSH